MNAAIIVCSTLTNHVKAAQKKMNTNYPIIELDNSKHSKTGKILAVGISCHGTTSGGNRHHAFGTGSLWRGISRMDFSKADNYAKS